MKTIRLTVSMLLLAYLLLGCSSGSIEPIKAATQGSMQTLTKDQNGQTLTMRVNEILQVSLDGNPTTGYVWETKDLDAALLAQQGELVYSTQATATRVAGAGGTYLFSYKALKAGQATLTIIYHRPWEKEAPPAETFQVTLKIVE